MNGQGDVHDEGTNLLCTYDNRVGIGNTQAVNLGRLVSMWAGRNGRPKVGTAANGLWEFELGVSRLSE